MLYLRLHDAVLEVESQLAPQCLSLFHYHRTMNLDKTFHHLSEATPLPAMLARVMQDLDRRTLQTPEEIHIRKLLHLFHIGCLGDLLIIEEYPRCRLLSWHLLANEGNVVTVMVSA